MHDRFPSPFPWGVYWTAISQFPRSSLQLMTEVMNRGVHRPKGNHACPLCFRFPLISKKCSDSVENFQILFFLHKKFSFYHQNFWWPFLAVDSNFWTSSISQKWCIFPLFRKKFISPTFYNFPPVFVPFMYFFAYNAIYILYMQVCIIFCAWILYMHIGILYCT